MTELVLINISGEDKPGLTAAISELLAEFDIDILDVGQAVIHNHLSLGILINITGHAAPIREEVLAKAQALGVNIKFSAVAEASYEDWVGLQGAFPVYPYLVGAAYQSHPHCQGGQGHR